MRYFLLLSFFFLKFSCWGQQDSYKNVPLENVLARDSNFKKIIKFFDKKIWSVEQHCLDDSCRAGFDSSYYCFTGWSGYENGENVYIFSNLYNGSYRFDEVTNDNVFMFMGCKPWIGIKKVKSTNPLVFVIEHVSEAGNYTMEMTLLNSKFIIEGPASYEGIKKELTQYRIAKPTGEALKSILNLLK